MQQPSGRVMYIELESENAALNAANSECLSNVERLQEENKRLHERVTWLESECDKMISNKEFAENQNEATQRNYWAAKKKLTEALECLRLIAEADTSCFHEDMASECLSHINGSANDKQRDLEK